MSAGRDTVLLVDDEEAALDSVLALLTSHGYEAIGANSGQTALVLLRDRAITCETRPRCDVLWRWSFQAGRIPTTSPHPPDS